MKIPKAMVGYGPEVGNRACITGLAYLYRICITVDQAVPMLQANYLYLLFFRRANGELCAQCLTTMDVTQP